MNRDVWDATDELRILSVKNGDERRRGVRLAKVQIFSIAREGYAMDACWNVGTDLFEGAVEQEKLRPSASHEN